jgi:hypothetical protein
MIFEYIYENIESIFIIVICLYCIVNFIDKIRKKKE